MLLLNTDTLQLETFVDNKVPAYAILSHVWGLPEDEISFEDMRAGAAKQKPGYLKLQKSSAIAVRDGLKYVWIDTCCIDKASSAELSEAINSMFRYYSEAKTCYVYLEDVSSSTPDASFARSKWFTRGWTLQELIAPRHVRFLSQYWLEIGTKVELATEISQITKVDVESLKDSRHLCQVSLAQRMSWASGRTTTREEDLAYCLLGIFDVNMPLLYGEGSKAFLRLQEEIMKGSTDQPLFAWTPSQDSTACKGGILARCPKDFSQASHIIRNGTNTHPYSMTNKGLQITLPIRHAELNAWGMVAKDKEWDVTAILSCHEEGNLNGPIGIELERVQGEEGVYVRTQSKPKVIEDTEKQRAEVRPIYILEDDQNTWRNTFHIWVRTIPSEKYGFNISKFLAVPPASGVPWNSVSRTLVWSKFASHQRAAVIFDHSSGPGVVVCFGIHSPAPNSRPLLHFLITAPVPWVHIFLLPQTSTQDGGVGDTERHFDFEQPMDTCASNAVGYTAPDRAISATIKWCTVMSEKVLVLDISAEDSSNMLISIPSHWLPSKDFQVLLVSLPSFLTKASLTLVFVFLERFFLMGDYILLRGPLWENRWDNFLFLFPSQFPRPLLRRSIPQIVPLLSVFYIGFLYWNIMEFLSDTIRAILILVQLYVSSWVFEMKRVFPPCNLSDWFAFRLDRRVVEYFWCFLEVLGYTKEISIIQDGFWPFYLSGIHGFYSDIRFIICLQYISYIWTRRK